MSWNNRTDSLLGSEGSSDSYSLSVSSSRSNDDQSTLLGKARANRVYILYGVIGILAVIIIALAAALHSAQGKESNNYVPPAASSSSTAAPIVPPATDSSSSTASWPTLPTLRDLVTIDKLMAHARGLQAIADTYGNRYINQPGFNASVAYIESVLRTDAPSLRISKQYFTRVGFEVEGAPDLVVTAGDDSFTYTYGTFYNVYIYSRSLVTASTPIVSVLNGGCSRADWAASLPSQKLGAIALVVRSTCRVIDREALAKAAGVVGIIQYNDDPTTGLLALEAYNTTLTWLSMRYEEGKMLELVIRAGANSSTPTPVTLTLNLTCRYPDTVITNLCADTPSGDPTSTIVIGSHSDGVIAGSGMVDNGSGTCANLVWATAVHQLLATPRFTPFPNRLRFCWWGAEEQGLLGSRYHVEVAKTATDVGNRLADYQLNLNFDMVACSNFVFGVLNGTSGYDYSNIPPAVVPGSQWITTLFANYFVQYNMPWDGKAFNGRSDYGPFLEAGLPAGGVSAFIDRLKTQEERDRYNTMLGPGMGGISGVAIDPCYHQKCDTINNINTFAFEQIGKANGEVLQFLARLEPSLLHAWLWPKLKAGEERPLVYTPVDIMLRWRKGLSTSECAVGQGVGQVRYPVRKQTARR